MIVLSIPWIAEIALTQHSLSQLDFHEQREAGSPASSFTLTHLTDRYGRTFSKTVDGEKRWHFWESLVPQRGRLVGCRVTPTNAIDHEAIPTAQIYSRLLKKLALLLYLVESIDL